MLFAFQRHACRRVLFQGRTKRVQYCSGSICCSSSYSRQQQAQQWLSMPHCLLPSTASSFFSTTTTTTTTARTTTASISRIQEQQGILPGLQKQGDLIQLCRDTLMQVDAIVATIEQYHTQRPSSSSSSSSSSPASDRHPPPSDSQVLRWVDSISNLLCIVVDAASLLQHAHYQESRRQEAAAVVQELQNCIQKLNGNTAIYECIAELLDSEDRAQELSVEEKRTAWWHVQSCRGRGIHLPQQQLDALLALQNVQFTLESRFSSNLYEPQAPYEVMMPSSSSSSSTLSPHQWKQHMTAGLPSDIAQQITLQPQPGNEDKYMLVVPSDEETCSRISAFAKQEEMRRAIYMFEHSTRSNAVTQQNEEVLLDLLRVRSKLAQARGFENHQEFVLRELMAENAEELMNTCQSLRKLILPRVQQELQLLQHAKQQWNTLLGGYEQVNEGIETVMPWDRQFLMGSVKATHFQLNHADLCQYFSISNVLHGIQLLVHDLFGFELQMVPVSSNEDWSCHTTTSTTTSSPIQKAVLKNERGEILGIVYFDVSPRPYKFNSAGTFVLQSRCSSSPCTATTTTTTTTTTGQEDEENKNGNNGSIFSSSSSSQIPIVALMMSISNPNMFSHQEFTTFLHEFGHVLHHLLSQTEMQYLSGTRGEQDWIETPSSFMEHFALNHRFLAQFAKHTSTGKAIDRETVDRLKHSQYLFIGLDTLDLTRAIMIDTRLSQRVWTEQDAVGTLRDVVREVSLEYGYVPWIEDTNWVAKFGHLASYSGCYYTYLFGHTLGDAIWRQWFVETEENGSKSGMSQREAGQLLLDVVLRPGGGLDPRVIIQNVLNAESKDEINIPALGQQYSQRMLTEAPRMP